MISSRHSKWMLFLLFFVFCLNFESFLLLFVSEGADAALLMLAFVMLISIIFLMFSQLCSKVSRTLSLALISLFLAFSIVELKLIYFESFSNISTFQLIILFAVIGLIIAVFLTKSPAVITPPSSAFFLSALIFIAAPVFMHLVESGSDDSTGIQSDKSNELISKLDAVKFVRKPNVYILVYDSLIPIFSARKYMGIQHLPYESEFQRSFIELSPAASIEVPTQPSLNGFMRLDQAALSNSGNYFSGQEQSVLSTLFKNNGYQITTGYTTYYFGEKGKFIDRYVNGKTRTLSITSLCIDVGQSLGQLLRAYGACSVIGDNTSIEHLVNKLWGVDIHKKHLALTWDNTVKAELLEATSRDKPQIKIFYTYRPNGHTSQNYRHDNQQLFQRYRENFLTNSNKMADLLESLAETIALHDPSSIVMVFGDHGAWLSRGVDPVEQPTFFYEDRHLVSLAILRTNESCVERSKLSKFSDDYFTPSRVLAAIASCLSADESYLSNVLHFDDPEVLKNIMKEVSVSKADNSSESAP